MSEPQASAQIIPFPVRQRAPEPPAPAAPPSFVRSEGLEPLHAALPGLNAALEKQKIAVQAWRDSMHRLSCLLGSVNDSLVVCESQLAGMRDQIAGPDLAQPAAATTPRRRD